MSQMKAIEQATKRVLEDTLLMMDVQKVILEAHLIKAKSLKIRKRKSDQKATYLKDEALH